MRHSSLRPAILAIAAASPAVAHANAGIRFFMPASVLLVVAVIPVIAIESLVLCRRLKVRLRRALFLAACANGLSTVLGAVIGVALDFGLATATGSSGVYGGVGLLISLALMFGITLWIEILAIRRLQRDDPRPNVRGATLPHGRFARATRVEPGWRRVRRVSTEETGRIVAQVAFPGSDELDGKTVVYEPEVRGGAIVAWHCYVPEAPFKYFPATCRQRAAGEFVPH